MRAEQDHHHRPPFDLPQPTLRYFVVCLLRYILLNAGQYQNIAYLLRDANSPARLSGSHVNPALRDLARAASAQRRRLPLDR